MLRITYLFPISTLLRPFPIKWYEKLVSSRLQKKGEYLSVDYWSFVSVSFYKEKEIAGNEETVPAISLVNTYFRFQTFLLQFGQKLQG